MDRRHADLSQGAHFTQDCGSPRVYRHESTSSPGLKVALVSDTTPPSSLDVMCIAYAQGTTIPADPAAKKLQRGANWNDNWPDVQAPAGILAKFVH